MTAILNEMIILRNIIPKIEFLSPKTETMVIKVQLKKAIRKIE